MWDNDLNQFGKHIKEQEVTLGQSQLQTREAPERTRKEEEKRAEDKEEAE